LGAEIDGNPAKREIGAADVVDIDEVRVGEGPQDDSLDPVEVERGIVDVAGDVHMVAVGRDVDNLVDGAGEGRLVEHQRVHAIPALDRIAAVAPVPHERVVTRAEVHRVVAASALHHVVVIAAEDLVCTRAGYDGVVANAAVQECSGQRAISFVERDQVVAVLPGNGDQAGIGDGGGAARDRHGPAVDEKIPGGVAAGVDRVVEIVADRGQHAGNGIEAAGDSHRLSFRRSVAARMRVGSVAGADSCRRERRPPGWCGVRRLGSSLSKM
jgi:hypothetical protein